MKDLICTNCGNQLFLKKVSVFDNGRRQIRAPGTIILWIGKPRRAFIDSSTSRIRIGKWDDRGLRYDEEVVISRKDSAFSVRVLGTVTTARSDEIVSLSGSDFGGEVLNVTRIERVTDPLLRSNLIVLYAEALMPALKRASREESESETEAIQKELWRTKVRLEEQREELGAERARVVRKELKMTRAKLAKVQMENKRLSSLLQISERRRERLSWEPHKIGSQ